MDLVSTVAIGEMKKNGVEDRVIDIITESLTEMVNPLFGFHTKYLQNKLLAETAVFIEPKEIVLGNELTYKVKNGELEMKEIPRTCVYVSILDTLQVMLTNKQFSKMATSYDFTQRQNGIYFDVADGSFFQDNVLSIDDAPFFYIFIFQDALELCNPLGNRSGKHKVVMFYWSILNIHPRYRSRLSAIKLFAIVKRSVLDNYGFEAVMDPFFKEIDTLSGGVDFLIEGLKTKCYGKVVLCLGDTEGQQQIGGFKVGVGWSYRKCRMCYATSGDVRNNFDTKTFTSREKETHANELESMDNSPNENVKNELGTTFGIISRSCLFRLNGFDVTKQLPHDIMHVVLEGVLPYECQLVLSVFMDQGLFKLDDINYRLRIFDFTYVDQRSKPEPLKKTVFVTGERKLKYSAENAKIFIKILPFLLADLVQTADPFYKFLLELCEIVAIVYSPVLSDGTVGYLEHLIRDHLANFKELFPEQNLIPKHHYLLEIPRLIKLFGPPIRYCCMRFEAMHKVFKSFARVIDFKTMTVSLAKRYLTSTCEEHENIFSTQREDGPAHVLTATDLEYFQNAFRQKMGDFCYSLNWVKFYGTKYLPKKCVVAAGADKERELPVFGLIERVILSGDVVYLLLKMYFTESFSPSFSGYSVSETNEKEMFQISKLLDYNVYQVVRLDDNNLIVPIKYDLTDLISEHLNDRNPLHN